MFYFRNEVCHVLKEFLDIPKIMFYSETSSAMFSKILPIILAVNFIFWGKGDGINVTPSEFEQVKHCYQAGRLAAKAYMEALGKQPDTDAQKIAIVCVSITVS